MFNTLETITFDAIYDYVIAFKNNDSLDIYTVKLSDFNPQDLYKSFIITFERLFKDKFEIISISNKKVLIYIDNTYIIISFDNEQEYEDYQTDNVILNFTKYKNDESAVIFYENI